MQREMILNALEKFIAQRPGLEPRNYISHGADAKGRAAYRAESRSITRDRRDAEQLLRAVALTSMPVETLVGAFRAYSGRLTLREGKPGPDSLPWMEGQRVELDYCTGQYWPTEYRRAVCAVLSTALWDYRRDDYADVLRDDATPQSVGKRPGDLIRASFRREFGARFARRWFDA